MIRLELTTPPSLNNLYPTGSNGKRFLSPAYRRWLAESETALWLTKVLPIEGPVDIAVRYEDVGRGDLDNYYKAISDFCVKHKLIADDKRAIVRRISLAWDKNVKGCVVEITEAK